MNSEIEARCLKILEQGHRAEEAKRYLEPLLVELEQACHDVWAAASDVNVEAEAKVMLRMVGNTRRIINKAIDGAKNAQVTLAKQENTHA